MFKGEAEGILRRAVEDMQAEMAAQQQPAQTPVFTEAQIQVLSTALMKVCGRMIEEAFSSWRPGAPGSKPTFFMD